MNGSDVNNRDLAIRLYSASPSSCVLRFGPNTDLDSYIHELNIIQLEELTENIYISPRNASNAKMDNSNH